ncbi:uncharacterized protein LOC132562397 [Ylistrum balloti]|uniref:uncharacterized protein LOC132562397 n=1 Tax=Ylistrum balloti TaxID=509963 RepID=UPI0029059F62|nr:uncharacterized protein LOC132562397 [Ylistrum balloti]
MLGYRFQRYIWNNLMVLCLLVRSGNMITNHCSSAHGTIAKGQRLDGYTFRTLENLGTKQCVKECFLRPSCLSINHHINMTCELNMDSDTNQPGSLSQNIEYSYSNIDTWTGFSGNCTRSTCSAGQKCFEFTSTTKCVVTECMNRPLLGVIASMEHGSVGQGFQATCTTGYEARGNDADVTCMGNGQWDISSSYCHRTDSSGWILLARFGSGNSESVLSTWTETGRDDNSDANMPDECKETNTSSVCTRHFRSGLIDEWETLNPTQVKFSLYTSGIEVVYITLNATDSDLTSWFSKERLLSTSFTDLTTNSTTNFFSLSGPNASRRFYIHKSYGGCPNDIGWVQIMDGQGVCFYDTAVAYPKFMYSSNNQSGLVGTDTVVAEVLAIFMKT